MTWNLFMYGAGVGCLIAMAGLSIGIIWTSIVPQWQRIWRLANGHIEPVFHTLFPEASSARPAQILRDQLGAVKADDQPTREVA